MARIDFPSNPSDGQTFTVTVAGANTVYTYNATHGVWRSLASRESYLQVANLQPALDKYLQVANSTSFSTTGQLDAYLQVANSTSFATTSQLDAYLQVANSTSFATTSSLDAYLQVANSTGFASSTDLDAYLQVANLQPQLDKYLQVANSTSFATTSSLDAYLQVANSTSFASTSELDAYLQVANLSSYGYATTSQLDQYLQVANSTSFATTSQLDAYLQVTNSISLNSFDVITSTPSGNGSLVYNSSNGSFTFTPANATQGGGGGVTQDTLDNYLQVANGVSLTAFDVLTSTPSGNGSLVYNSSNGSFTFTPADATQGGGGGGGASVTASDTAPSSPSAGDLWFHTTQLKLYVYYSDGSSNQWIQTNSGVGNRVDEFIKAYRYQGTLAINTGDTRLYLQDSYILKGIHAYVDTAPTGSSVITDVKKNGSSLQTITVAAGATTASNTSLSHTFVSGDYLTVDITQVGSSTAGENLYMVFTFN